MSISCALTALVCSTASATSYPPLKKVIILAGHTTGENRGAKAYYYGYENVFNDTIVNYFSNSKFRIPGVDYIIVPSALDLSLQQRVEMAQENDVNLYIEVHHDSGDSKDIEKAEKEGKNSPLWKEMSGFCVLYYDDGDGHESAFPQESRKFANLLADEMIKAGFKPDTYHADKQKMLLADRNRGIYNRVEPNRLYVLRNAKYPAVLLECGYIMNPNDVSALANPDTHKKIVTAINNAIRLFFEIK